MSLLNYARDGLRGLLDFEWNVAPEASQAEALPGADVAAARAGYKDNYRLASEAALKAGTSGWNMLPATRQGAQVGYENDLVRSASIVDQVRKMRDQSGARERIAKLIANPQSQLDAQNRELLGTLAPDQALDAAGKLVRNPGMEMPVVPAADGAYVRQPDGTYKFERTRSERAGGGQARLIQKSVVNEVTGQNDLVFYDPYTGAEVSRQPGAGTAPGRGGIEQAKAAGFELRMREAGGKIDRLGEYVPSAAELVTIQKIVSGEGGPLVMATLNSSLSNEARRYAQFVNDWIRAKLRAESGAVIGVDEFIGDFLTYMPMPGDDKQTLEDKRAARKVALRAMGAAAGGALIRDQAPAAPAPAPAAAPAPSGVPDPTQSPLWQKLGIVPESQKGGQP